MRKLKKILDSTKEEEKKEDLCIYLIEKVKVMQISQDKNKIMIGTTHGTVIVLSVEDFKVE